jgi:hypothetical protein
MSRTFAQVVGAATLSAIFAILSSAASADAGLIEGRGTIPPDSWDETKFLGFILRSLVE